MADKFRLIQRGKVTRREVPIGREAVTFPCRNRAGGDCAHTARQTGVVHDRRRSREPADAETATATEVEGGIRDFVRRDAASLRRQRPKSDSELVANNISSLLQRVAGTSVQEIDRLIAELQTLREMLSTSEGARVQREIVQYAT